MTKPKFLSHFEFVETLPNKFYSCQNAVVLDSVADPSRIRRIRMFWASRIHIHWYEGGSGFRILLFSSKNSKKNLDSFCFVTSLWLFIFEKECKCSFKKYY